MRRCFAPSMIRAYIANEVSAILPSQPSIDINYIQLYCYFMKECEADSPRSEELPTDAQVRVVSRELVMSYGAYGNHQRVLELGPAIGRISAGIDPDLVDTESADYKAGAVEALSAISNSMLEMKPAEEQ